MKNENEKGVDGSRREIKRPAVFDANFIKEIRQGNETAAMKMLDHGNASPFASSRQYGSALMISIEGGLEGLALAIISRAAKEAASNKSQTDAWTESGGHLGETPLWAAAKGNYRAIAEALMEAGASMRTSNASQCSLLCWCLANEREQIAASMIERSRLGLRRARDHSSDVKLAWVEAKRLSCLDDLNAEGDSAALMLFKQGRYELAEALIRAGAAVNMAGREWGRAMRKSASPSQASSMIDRISNWQSETLEEAREEVKKHAGRLFAAERLSKSLAGRGMDASGLLAKMGDAIAQSGAGAASPEPARRAATGGSARRR